jgi:hypothetical protein
MVKGKQTKRQTTINKAQHKNKRLSNMNATGRHRTPQDVVLIIDISPLWRGTSGQCLVNAVLIIDIAPVWRPVASCGVLWHSCCLVFCFCVVLCWLLFVVLSVFLWPFWITVSGIYKLFFLFLLNFILFAIAAMTALRISQDYCWNRELYMLDNLLANGD